MPVDHTDHPPTAPDPSAPQPRDGLASATLAVTAGRPDRRPGAPVNPGVELSATYVSAGTVLAGEPLYARMDTASWHGLEAAIGQLEGAGADALVFGSGMAAISAVMSLVPHGGRVVLPRHAYQVTQVLARDLTERSGIEVEQADVTDTAAVGAALSGAGGGRPADLLWLESPTNPMLEVADLRALSAAARAAGALVAVDNTFATPLRQRPLALGAHVVVHSVTKYLAGHSDVVLGAVVAQDEHLRDRIHQHRTTHGGIAGPWEAWLALRGLRTLAVRLDRAEASAAELARRLQAHPAVTAVRYPGLPEDPGYAVARQQMAGPGAMVAIEVRGGAAAADAVVDAVRLWVPATSLGGVESTIERRRRFPTESPTVPENLLRLSVGIEDVEDLWADLEQALRTVA